MRSIRERRSGALLWHRLLGAAIVGSALASACTVARERPAGGVHPPGFTLEESPDFHGAALRTAGYPLEECRACHGDDYAGGATGVSCLGSCHSEGVEACDTCHGAMGDPLPASGAHPAHAGMCEVCHVIPTDARGEFHPNGNADVVLSGLALKEPTAAWVVSERRCSSIYCHGGASMSWDDASGPLGCDACHGAPPPSHARFRVDAAPEGCAACHPIAPDERHVDGKVDVNDLACDACHGSGPLGVPAPSLLGEVDPSTKGVGAHRRHVDETLGDRIGVAVPCKVCHVIPASVSAPGHLDAEAPADVSLVGQGTYDAASGRCVVACHWDKDPGASWTDASGAERACDACHGFPPKVTRKGTAHPPAPDLAACLSCHPFDPARHVDGHVDFLP